MGKVYHDDGEQWLELRDERPPISLKDFKRFNVSHLAGWGDGAERYRAYAQSLITECHIHGANGEQIAGAFTLDILDELDFRQLDWIHSEIITAVITLPLATANHSQSAPQLGLA